MKKSEIKVGGEYTARVSGKFVTVRVDSIREIQKFSRTDYRGISIYRDKTVYDVTNLVTGRKLVFESAAKFRSNALVVM